MGDPGLIADGLSSVKGSGECWNRSVEVFYLIARETPSR